MIPYWTAWDIPCTVIINSYNSLLLLKGEKRKRKERTFLGGTPGILDQDLKIIILDLTLRICLPLPWYVLPRYYSLDYLDVYVVWTVGALDEVDLQRTVHSLIERYQQVLMLETALPPQLITRFVYAFPEYSNLKALC